MTSSCFFLFFLPLLLGAVACTRQESPPPTEIPLSTLAPALTATVEAIRLLPTFTLIPNTATLTPLPLYTLEPTAAAEGQLIQSVIWEKMWDGTSNIFPNTVIRADQIRITIYYKVDKGNTGQLREKLRFAENRIPFALCGFQEGGISARPIVFEIEVLDQNSFPQESEVYCVTTEAFLRINCAAPAKVDVSALTSVDSCPMKQS
jgi:hypothetical protein